MFHCGTQQVHGIPGAVGQRLHRICAADLGEVQLYTLSRCYYFGVKGLENSAGRPKDEGLVTRGVREGLEAKNTKTTSHSRCFCFVLFCCTWQHLFACLIVRRCHRISELVKELFGGPASKGNIQ